MEVVGILKCLDLLGVVHIANWSLCPLHTIPLGLALEDKRELANFGLVSLGAFQSDLIAGGQFWLHWPSLIY